MLGTKWYTLEMLRLEVLDAFDFFAKVDVDVFWLQAVDLAAVAAAQRAHWLHSFDVESAFSPRCSRTLHSLLPAYLEAAGCGEAHAAAAAARDPRTTFYSNFVMGWLGLFQSPQLLGFAQYWWSWQNLFSVLVLSSACVVLVCLFRLSPLNLPIMEGFKSLNNQRSILVK